MATNNIDFISLNCYGYKGNCVYIDKLTKTHDCLSLSELWLTQSEFHLLHNYKNDFHIFFQPAKQLEHGRPFGGTALMMRKSKFSNVDTIIQENYVTAVRAKHKNRTLLVFGVYLQSTNSSIDYIETYNTQLASLSGIMNQFIDTADPILLGDFQSCPYVDTD